jgi:hypothetical protein
MRRAFLVAAVMTATLGIVAPTATAATFRVDLASGEVAASNYSASYSQDRQAVPFVITAPSLAGVFAGIAEVGPSQAVPITFTLSLRGVTATLTATAIQAGTIETYSGSLALFGDEQRTTAFNGASWSEVAEEVRKFLLRGDTAKELQRESARLSPFDPVAGNPSSLMARAVAFDFASAFTPFASNIVDEPQKVAQATGLPAGALRGPMRGLPGLGAYAAVLRDEGLTVKSLTIPFSYVLRSDLDPRRQFSIALPLTLVDVDGARATQGTLAASVRQPLAKDWALSASVGYSVVDSKDLGAAGQIGSFAVTSSYVIRTDSGDLGIGNMVGYYRTISGTINGIDTGSGIANTAFRNGLLWSMPAPQWIGQALSVEFTLTNTHYLGSELYLRNYSEVGVSLGTNKRADSNRGYTQGGLSFLVSSKTKGVAANYAVWF